MRQGTSLVVVLLIAGVSVSLSGCVPTSAGADGAEATQDTGEVPTTTIAPAVDEEDVLPVVGIDEVAPFPLDQVIDVDLENVTIRELADWIHEEFDVPVAIVEFDDGTDRQERARFTIQGRNQRLFTILGRSLYVKFDNEWLDFGCVVRDGVVILGREDSFIDRHEIVHYDISDLVDRGIDVDVLKQMIYGFMSNNGNAMWREVDGFGGTINFFRGFLVISQVPSVQLEVALLLAALREPRVLVLRLGILEDDRQNELRLKEPISLTLTDVPFVDAIRQFSEVSGVPMQVHGLDLQDEGLHVDVPVSLSVFNIRAESALNALLVDFNTQNGLHGDPVVRWLAENGQIVITVYGCGGQSTRLYDVSDFVKSEQDQIAFNRLLEDYTDGSVTPGEGVSGEYVLLEPGWFLLRDDEYAIARIDEVLAKWQSLGLNDPERDRFPVDEPSPPPMPMIFTYRFLMHVDTATDLLGYLPAHIASGTWRDADHPDAIGKIHIVRLGAMEYTPEESRAEEVETADATEELTDADVMESASEDGDNETEPSDGSIEFPAALLIIEHQPSVLTDVRLELQRLSPESWSEGSEGFHLQIPIRIVDCGGAGGGFSGGGDFGGGGGFFQVP